MDYMRDLSDFIEDLADCDYDNPIVAHLSQMEEQMTVLLQKLRMHIDRFRVNQRSAALTRTTRVSWRTQGTPNVAKWAATRRAILPRRIAIPIPIATTEIAERETEVHITNMISLRATEVTDMRGVQKSGVLYYIRSMRRFAMMIANMTLCGNIGIVYVGEASPSRVQDCTSYPHCRANCDFYHNPMKCANSMDVRNFFASSWLYTPTSYSQYTEKKKLRKLSSLNHLDRDLATITADDISYYGEQLMHDILCFAVMNYYVKTDV